MDDEAAVAFAVGFDDADGLDDAEFIIFIDYFFQMRARDQLAFSCNVVGFGAKVGHSKTRKKGKTRTKYTIASHFLPKYQHFLSHGYPGTNRIRVPTIVFGGRQIMAFGIPNIRRSSVTTTTGKD